MSAPTREVTQARLAERVGAAIIDAVLLVVGGLLIGQLLWGLIWVVALFFDNQWDVSHDIATNLTLLAGIPLTWLYFAVSESSYRQATPGKIVFRLSVADVNGDRITFGRATLRFWLKVGSAAMLGIGIILAAFTDKRQGMHDILAKTVVLKTGG
jgi:uncharacterized RDD family membrane protein YckC